MLRIILHHPGYQSFKLITLKVRLQVVSLPELGMSLDKFIVEVCLFGLIGGHPQYNLEIFI